MTDLLAMIGMHGIGWAELGELFAHFLVLSMLAVGGAITTAPDMQRYMVHEHGWLTDTQFTSSVALAQAAPGPNILFVALLGWNVAGLVGVLVTMLGIMLPSSVLALSVARWGRQRSESRGLRAFTAGMTPITLGLLVSTGWVLAAPTRTHVGGMLLAAFTVVAMVRTKWSPMWLIALGAVVGALGWM